MNNTAEQQGSNAFEPLVLSPLEEKAPEEAGYNTREFPVRDESMVRKVYDFVNKSTRDSFSNRRVFKDSDRAVYDGFWKDVYRPNGRDSAYHEHALFFPSPGALMYLGYILVNNELFSFFLVEDGTVYVSDIVMHSSAYIGTLFLVSNRENTNEVIIEDTVVVHGNPCRHLQYTTRLDIARAFLTKCVRDTDFKRVIAPPLEPDAYATCYGNAVVENSVFRLSVLVLYHLRVLRNYASPPENGIAVVEIYEPFRMKRIYRAFGYPRKTQLGVFTVARDGSGWHIRAEDRQKGVWEPVQRLPEQGSCRDGTEHVFAWDVADRSWKPCGSREEYPSTLVMTMDKWAKHMGTVVPWSSLVGELAVGEPVRF